MNIVKTYFNVFKKDFANFKGTEKASTYIIFMVGSWIISVVLLIVGQIVPSASVALNLISTILGLIVFIPSLAIITRRLHSKGKTALWLLLLLIPIVNIIILVWLAFGK
ncbi:MAG: DUF805 domain-containing protein [Clostridiales bacterium]|jgi:uncharacterized membrane protein YhaH (DUF805 family)|nr:DUF805 domain-containing protein [Clostridiales bacterium]